MRPADAELLQKVAGRLNTFSNDGSFLDSCQKQGKERQMEVDLPSARVVSQADRAQPSSPPEQRDDPSGAHHDHASRPENGQELVSTTDGDNKNAAARLRAKLLGRLAPGPAKVDTKVVQPASKSKQVFSPI